MNHQGALVQVCGNLRHLKTAGCSPHQNQRPKMTELALLHQNIQRFGGHKGPKRKPGQGQGANRRQVLNHRQEVLSLANAVIVHPLGVTHPPEVEANRRPPLRHKGPGQRLNHLVVHGAAKQRVRMRNHGHAFCRHAWRCSIWCRRIHQDFNSTRGALDPKFLRTGVHLRLLSCVG